MRFGWRANAAGTVRFVLPPRRRWTTALAADSAAVGLWEDRLHLGAGSDPFADSDDEGRYCYFIGSSLIPILQALQGGSDTR